MKYNPKQYAIALYEAVKGKGKKETEKTIDDFLKFIKEGNDLRLIDKIFSEFEKYSLHQEGMLFGEIIISHKMSEEIKKEITKKIIHRLADKKIRELNLEEKMDNSLIGGFKVKLEDVLVDASINGALGKIKNELLKTV